MLGKSKDQEEQPGLQKYDAQPNKRIEMRLTR